MSDPWKKHRSAFSKPNRLFMEELLKDPDTGKVALPATFDELAELIDCMIFGHMQDGQGERAKKPRPKKNPTHRSEVIEEMRHYRFEGGHLDEFLASEPDGITIAPVDAKQSRFTITCEAILPPRKLDKVVSKGTLYEWWTEAAKI